MVVFRDYLLSFLPSAYVDVFLVFLLCSLVVLFFRLFTIKK